MFSSFEARVFLGPPPPERGRTVRRAMFSSFEARVFLGPPPPERGRTVDCEKGHVLLN